MLLHSFSPSAFNWFTLSHSINKITDFLFRFSYHQSYFIWEPWNFSILSSVSYAIYTRQIKMWFSTSSFLMKYLVHDFGNTISIVHFKISLYRIRAANYTSILLLMPIYFSIQFSILYYIVLDKSINYNTSNYLLLSLTAR